ncbi:BCCT family transporter [Clostridiaceae bacterium 35-E11]
MNHFADPSFGAANTAEAARLAMNYTFFHWGLHPWASYAVVALPLAYFQFRRGMPGLISSIFYPLIGEKGVKGPIGKAIDTFVVVLTLFGVASSFGLGAMQVHTGLHLVYNLPNTVATSIIIIAICTILFTFSTVRGIERGMKILSNTNMVLAFGLMIFVLLVGPTKYIVKIFVEGVGDYLQNIVWMSFYTDAQGTVAQKAGIVVLIFFLTSADCATLVVNMFTTGGDLEPHYSIKIFWGVIVGALASMFVIAGGLKAVQTLSFALSFPFMILMFFMLYSIIKVFNRDEVPLAAPNTKE